MKKSVIAVVFWGLITLLLLAIALPTVVFKINEEYYRLRGLDPRDVDPTFLVQEYKFTPSLELQGGSIATIDVDLASLPLEEREQAFAVNRDNFAYRLFVFQSLLKRQLRNFNYEIQEAVATDNSDYKLFAKFPGVVDNEQLSIFTTPGDLSVWIEDSAASQSEEENTNPYGNRKLSDLTNEDIASVNVVTDSTCIFNDPAAPRNFCVRMTFKAQAQSKFNVAFLSGPQSQYPPILVVDGAPVAVQSMGRLLDPVNPGLTVDWYPLVDDSYDTTAILASILNERPLNRSVSLGEFGELAPTAGASTLDIIKLSLLSAFIAVNVLLFVYFRKRAWFALFMNLLFVIYTVALMKMFGLILDVPLIAGVVAAFVIFLGFVSYALYQIRTASRGNLTEEELQEVYERTRKNFTQLTVLVSILGIIFSYWAPGFLLSLFIGFGFGIIMGFVVLSFPGMQLLKLIFLRSLKWKVL